MASGLTLSEWQGDRFQKLIDLDIEKKLKTVGILLMNEMKAELSAKGNIDKKTPSKPGEFPAKVTGRLAGSVTYNVIHEAGRWLVRVGSPVIYGKFLELGTIRMAARPWVRPVMRKNAAFIRKLFGGH